MIITAPAGRDTLITLCQFQYQAQQDSPVPDLVNENLKFCPEAMLFEAGTIDGTSYPALVRTGYPTAHFRQYNQGVPSMQASYRTTEVQTAMIDTRVEADRKYADNYPKSRGGAAAWQAIKASEAMVAIMRLIGYQTYYGLANDPLGFPGFWELVDPSMMIDAGGAVQADGFRSSVWAVKTGELDVKHIYGNGETLALPSEWRIADSVPDPVNFPLNKMEVYVNHWGGRPGLQVLSKNSIACIKNVTSDPAHPVTMSMLRQLLETFPIGVVPDYIMMARATRTQVRNTQKTALITDPPTPTDVDDVPIVATDSISTQELAIYV